MLPRYANTHTESSGTGLQTTRLACRTRARSSKKRSGGDEDGRHLRRFGANGGHRQGWSALLGIGFPRAWTTSNSPQRRHRRRSTAGRFIGPFEHHSNELPWRESIADVVVIPQDPDGHIDAAQLERELTRYAARPLLIGSFSAASNVTGIVSDTHGISALLHRHGALSFWDFAAAARTSTSTCTTSPGTTRCPTRTRIFLSPHKFVGGPGTGVLVVRRELLHNRVPDVVGGGTVAYVNPSEHRYLDDPAHREEGGTPAIVESIRAGLVFQLKEAVGVDVIASRGTTWRAPSPGPGAAIEILALRGGGSIVSFVVRAPSGRYLHHNFVVALLNDLFGIQSRGGCSCAGPYGHRLLGDLDRSHEFEREIAQRLRGHQARLGPGQLQLLHLRGRLLLHRRGRAARGPGRVAPARRLPVRAGDGSVAAPPGTGGASSAPRAAEV